MQNKSKNDLSKQRYRFATRNPRRKNWSISFPVEFFPGYRTLETHTTHARASLYKTRVPRSVLRKSRGKI